PGRVFIEQVDNRHHCGETNVPPGKCRNIPIPRPSSVCLRHCKCTLHCCVCHKRKELRSGEHSADNTFHSFDMCSSHPGRHITNGFCGTFRAARRQILRPLRQHTDVMYERADQQNGAFLFAET